MVLDNMIYVIKTHDGFEHLTQVHVYKREDDKYKLIDRVNCLDLTTALEVIKMLSSSQAILTEAI